MAKSKQATCHLLISLVNNMTARLLFILGSLTPAICLLAQEAPVEAPIEKQEYNIELPTGTKSEQPQPIYSSKDMTFNIGTARLGLYGFIKVNYLGETNITGDTADVRLDHVPLSTDLPDRHMQSIIDARTSRLGIKIEDVVGTVFMKGAFEGDFSNSHGTAIHSNSRLFRMRTAYMSAETDNDFFMLFGQYYALAMHYPEIDMPTRINELHYPAGVINARQPQFRFGYKQYFSDTRLLQYEVNAETQGYNTTGIVSDWGGDTEQASYQKWPLFTAKISWLSDMFKWDASFSGTQAYAIANSQGTRVGAPAWGVVSNASFKWKDLLLWGTAHHFVGLTGLSSDYFRQMTLINHDTALKMVTANGGCAALRYDFWSGHLWADVMYGIERADEIPGTIFSGNTLKKIEDFRINLVGFFWKHWQAGVEYERTYVEAYNKVSGCDNMFHIGVWYIFGQP